MRRPNKTSKVALEEEIDFYKEVERFVAREIMDEDEIELIEKVWRGEAATDEEIEKNVDVLFEMVID